MRSGLDFDELQSLLAGGPVIVVGPGCQRVGYERSSDWKQVERRFRMLAAALPAEEPTTSPPRDRLRAFLSAFWEGGLTGVPKTSFDSAGLKPSTADVARTALSYHLLVALSASTECLGHVIASGRTPVRFWQDVRFQRDMRNLPDGDAAAARAALTRAEKALLEFSEISTMLSEWLANYLEDPTDDAEIRRALGAAGFAAEQQVEPSGAPLADALKVMRVSAIAAHVEMLCASHFTAKVTMPISGATIEWLSDLLWHLMSSGSGVPPSRKGMAFYLNLVNDPKPTERLFTRPSPGEYRGDSATLHNEFYRLLRTYDCGLEDGPSTTEGRCGLFRVLAATMVENWEQVKAQSHLIGGGAPSSESEGPPDPGPRSEQAQEQPVYDHYTVALVEVYDLLLERQLLEVCDNHSKIHTVVPVWVGPEAGPHQLRWLWGTYTKHHAGWSPSDLAKPATDSGLTLDWRWSDRLAFTDVAGPIVVKVNGSPLVKLGEGRTTVRTLGLGNHKFPDHHVVRLATIFSEYDAVTSMLGFAEGTTKDEELNAVLPWGLTNTALSWRRQKWLFLGDSFPEWLSRLRIAYRANPRGVNRGSKIAVDRAFDWPELALLKTLDITPWVGDLSQVASYAQPQNSSSSAHAAFLEAVHARCQKKTR